MYQLKLLQKNEQVVESTLSTRAEYLHVTLITHTIIVQSKNEKK